MPASVSLRRTLRTTPIFRSLPKQELDTVVTHLTHKEYRPGDILWRKGTRPGIIGIIQKGEVVVEYRTNGSVRHNTRLSAGAFLQPRDLRDASSPSSVSVYAATDVTLYVLHQEQIAVLRSKCPTLDTILAPAPQGRIRRLHWDKLWTIVVALLIAFLVWREIASILSGTLYLASDQLQASADYQRALDLLEYAVLFDPKATLAYNQQGYVLAQMGDAKFASTAFIQALSIDTTSGPALNNLAIIYFTADLTDRAIAFQQRAAQAEPNTAIVRYNLGLMLMEQNDYVEAIRAFKEASRINPAWALPHIQLSFASLQIGDYVGAERAARVATRLDPTQESAQLSLAIALYCQDRGQEALTSVENALDINPDNIVSRFYKALILRDLGEPDVALRTLHQLLTLSEDSQQRFRIAEEIESILRLSPGSVSEMQ